GGGRWQKGRGGGGGGADAPRRDPPAKPIEEQQGRPEAEGDGRGVGGVALTATSDVTATIGEGRSPHRKTPPKTGRWSAPDRTSTRLRRNRGPADATARPHGVSWSCSPPPFGLVD